MLYTSSDVGGLYLSLYFRDSDVSGAADALCDYAFMGTIPTEGFKDFDRLSEHSYWCRCISTTRDKGVPILVYVPFIKLEANLPKLQRYFMCMFSA